MPRFTRAVHLRTFERDFKRLDPRQQHDVRECIHDLMQEPIPAVRRWHSVGRSPAGTTIYTADVYPKHSYKVSCHIERDGDGELLVLRHVRDHKDIDRNP